MIAERHGRYNDLRWIDKKKNEYGELGTSFAFSEMPEGPWISPVSGFCPMTGTAVGNKARAGRRTLRICGSSIAARFG